MKRIWLILIILLLWIGLATAWQKPPAGTRIKPGHPDTQGLVGYWLFNEGTGSRAQDISGNNNYGTLNGPAWGPGRDGWALSFNGSSDCISADGLVGNIQNNTIGAIELRVNFNVLSTTQMMFSAQDKGDALSVLSLYLHGSNRIYAICYEAAAIKYNSYFSGAPTISDNTWYHLVLVQNGTDLILYQNGVAYDISTATDEQAWFNTINDIDSVTFGCRISGGSETEFTNGLIGNVGVYNRAPSATEIWQLYLNPYAMLQQQQVWQWFTLFARRIFLVH